MIMDTLWMECKPLGINVTLVAPGFVKSRIAQNTADLLHVSNDSLYPTYVPGIEKQLQRGGNGKGGMSASLFAEKVAKETMKAHPKRYMTLGKASTIFRFLACVPKDLVLGFLWKRFSRC